MGAWSNIYGALITQLETLGLPVAWENDSSFQPTQGTLFLSAYHMPSYITAAGLGDAAQNYAKGIFQVNVNAPSDKGSSQAYAQVDALCSLYKRGTRLTRNGQIIVCEKVEPAGGLWDDMWYVVPVSVWYYSYADNA